MIAVVDGPELDQVAVGRNRHRSISPAVPLAIASIIRDQEGLKIQLAGTTETARVHVYGSRYFGSEIPMQQLALPMPPLWGRRVSLPTSGYVSDLRLGDEYQYVLRRRYADKYPGVMLPQPGIILNPWETEETTNASQPVQAGDAPPPAMEAAPGRANSSRAALAAKEAETASSDFDFLSDPGVILANLRPDADGVVTVPLDLIDGLPILQVVACDAMTCAPAIPSRANVRCGNDRSATSQSIGCVQVTDARAGCVDRFTRSSAGPRGSLGSAQLQIYASVGDLFKLYKTMVSDSRMNDFDVVSVWSSLDQEAKLEAYSRLASHELHLFLWFHDRPFFQDVIRALSAEQEGKAIRRPLVVGIGSEALHTTVAVQPAQCSGACAAGHAVARVPRYRSSRIS